nr:hypothetical protein [Tanacetum cinerariifolium]
MLRMRRPGSCCHTLINLYGYAWIYATVQFILMVCVAYTFRYLQPHLTGIIYASLATFVGFGGPMCFTHIFLKWRESNEHRETQRRRRFKCAYVAKLELEQGNSSYLGLRKTYRLSLKNDMPPRDKVDDDFHNLGYVETEFLAIVVDDIFTSQTALSYESKSDKDNDNNEINIIQSSRDKLNTQRSNMLLEKSKDKIDKIFDKESFVMELKGKLVSGNGYDVLECFNLCTNLIDFLDMALPPRDQRHRMLMEHRDAQGNVMFTSRDCRRLFNIRGPLVHELILEFFSTFKFVKAVLELDTAKALQF